LLLLFQSSPLHHWTTAMALLMQSSLAVEQQKHQSHL
jgi:hypothetical protein